MKDLTAFKIAFRQLVKSGYTIETAFNAGVEAQVLFDKYIAEQIEASKLKPVDAETAMQNFTEAISLNPEQDQPELKCGGNCDMNYCDDNGCIERKRNLVEDVPCKPEHPQKFYWKPVEQFSKEDAFFDSADFLVTQVDGAVDIYATDFDMTKRGATHYLARCKEDKGDFVPCWEWVEFTDAAMQWDNNTQDEVKIHGLSSGGYYYRCDGDSSSEYPSLEAAQLEAERYYKMYVEPTLAK